MSNLSDGKAVVRDAKDLDDGGKDDSDLEGGRPFVDSGVVFVVGVGVFVVVVGGGGVVVARAGILILETFTNVNIYKCLIYFVHLETLDINGRDLNYYYN
jgi:hypothetical protein